MRRWPALLLCLLPAAAFADNVADARAAIARADSDWLAAMAAHDGARIAAPYARDGVFVLPDGSILTGRAAIAALYARRTARIAQVLGGGIHPAAVQAIAPGLVCEWGTGVIRYRDTFGKTVVGGGPYLTIWKRQPGADWQIVRNLVF